MVPHLRTRRNLTIVTNGVETALALAQESLHTVILLGGIMHNGGASVVGPLGERNLLDLHIKTAFLSCTAFSLEMGMTQNNLQEAQIKRQMVAAADQIVALVDSSKFGRSDLTAFAAINQLAHVLTDQAVEPRIVHELQRAEIAVTLCGETTVSTFAPIRQSERHYQIGFANLGEDQSIFAMAVRHGLEQAARNAGNVDLVIADNRLDGEVALKVADHLVAEGIHLAIEYQINERAGVTVASKFYAAQIPVIAVDIPMVGATYFGVDNYRSGHMAGVALGQWIGMHWQGRVDHVLVLQHALAGSLPAARICGQVDGLQEQLGAISPDAITYINGGTTADSFEHEVAIALDELSIDCRIAVLSFNDNATMGALRAARSQERETNLAVVSQGADQQVRSEIRRPNSPLIGSTAFWPERYGEKLITLALQILRGESVPPAVYVEHVFLDARNIDHYYPDDGQTS
jgi:ribose transport system substrate-binding protein